MSANWLREDCLKHVADRVEAGRVHFDIDYQFEFIQIQVDDIMHELNTMHCWKLSMNDGSIPTMAKQGKQGYSNPIK